MHTKKHILKFISSKKDEKKGCKEVEKIHKYFEAYIKHIALTVLRLEGGKYSASRQYVANSWIPCNEKNIKKIILKLFGQTATNQQYWARIIHNNPRLKVCFDLLFNYAISVRNQIFHGNYYNFEEGEEDFIFDIYWHTIEEMEITIANKKNGNRILQNTPKEFGALTGRLERDGQFKNILNFANAAKGYKLAKAKEIYKQLK